jgi:hypothetical protein
MENREAELETYSINKHSVTVWDFMIADDDKILAIFALKSGGIVINDCTCFYTPKGDLEFRLPNSVYFDRELEYPADRIMELLQAEIEKLKASGPNWNSPIPF